MSGSYAGISETVVQLVLYEQFKHYLITNNTGNNPEKTCPLPLSLSQTTFLTFLQYFKNTQYVF